MEGWRGGGEGWRMGRKQAVEVGRRRESRERD